VQQNGPTKSLLDVVEASVDYLRDIVAGLTVVDVVRYRYSWFCPYYLAFFRQASRAALKHTVETINWAHPVTLRGEQ